MSKTITIPLEQYECLRRHLNEAQRIIESFGVEVREHTAPELSEKELRVKKYDDLLSSGKRGKKSITVL